MHRRWAALLMLLMLLPASAQAMGYGTVWNEQEESGRTPLFDRPDGSILGMLEGGQAVLLADAAQGDWIQASLGSVGGYLHRTDLRAGAAPEEGESRLLDTMEMTIAPGMTATLELWGGGLRFGRDGYLCEIRVMQDGALIDRLSYLSETVPEDAPHLHVDDVNMDGYQDIIALRTMGASDAYGVWYLYDPGLGAFLRDFSLGRFSVWRYELDADRVHLREAPEKGAKSFGLYYTGTPVKIGRQVGDYHQVAFGTENGYMMSKYLATGEAAHRVQSRAHRGVVRLKSHDAAAPVNGYAGQSPMIAQVPDGNMVTVLGETANGWYYVFTGQEVGFMRAGDVLLARETSEMPLLLETYWNMLRAR